MALHAAVPEVPRFRILTAAEGLPNSTIPALARDRDGFLWIGNWDGLARYDGVGFRVWRHDPADPASLPGNIVQALHIDAQDRIWVATESGGLSMLDAQRTGFQHYRKADHPELHSDDVFAITSRDDALWFGSFAGGLNRLDANGTLQHFGASETDPASLPSDDIMSLAFDQAGNLWIGTLTGLARFDGHTFTRVSLPGAGQAQPLVFSLTADGGDMWAGTSAGVFVLRPGAGWTTPAWSQMFARPNGLIAVTNGEDGEFWLGSQGGLWRTQGGRAPVPIALDPQGTGTNRVLQALLRQPDAGMWVPVPSRGLGYLRSDWRRIAVLSTAEGLSPGLHRGIGIARAGGVWLTSSKGRVERVDTATGEITALPVAEDAFKRARLAAVLEDRSGRLWVGQGRTGLARYDPVHNTVQQWSSESAVDATPDTGTVDWLVEMPDGDIWLSSLGGGLQRRDAGTGKVLENVNAGSGHGLDAVDTDVIRLGPDGTLWLAGAQGVLRWHPQSRQFVPVVDAADGRVFAFAFQDADQLWLHRLAGLELWTRNAQGWQRSRRLALREGVPAVESTGLQLSADGQVWLGTRRGLFRINPHTGQVRHFGVRDGLLSQELNDSGLLLDGDGVLVATAVDGSLVLLDTQFKDPPALTPNLVIDGIQVSRKQQQLTLPSGGGFELLPGDHELHVSARLLSFDDPLANRYRSKLEGFDSDWVGQGASGERVFSTLEPGHYLLKLQAVDALGNASSERSLQFRVLPPWWRSGWGLALFTLLGVLLLAAVGGWYRGRLRRRTAWQLAEHKRQVAEQASLAKTRFLATLGHEVRTPMTGVLGMSELLLATPLDDKQRGYTHAIQNAGTHLLRLVNDALDIARIEAGKLELQQQDFDLRTVVDEVVGLSAPMAEQRGLRFTCHFAADAPAGLQGDPLRVRQILLNLLGNAIKFTDSGDVSLRIAPLLPQGVSLEVADTGPGINAEQQTRLFQRFEQAEGARTAERYGGSGLGLAICQELAVAMGGRIKVTSAPGAGTCFTVELPLPPASASAWSAAPQGRGTATAAGLSSLQVLLVEDDQTVAEVVASLLRARGHQVRHAPHGLVALTEIAAHSFDIALLDLDLPGLDGMALARQMRAQGFMAPLLAVTARADGDAETLARAAGFDGFLRKPVTGDLLVAAIAEAMHKPSLPA